MTMFHQQADGVRLVLTGGPVQRCDAVVHVCHERSLNRTDQFLYSLSIIPFFFFQIKKQEFRKEFANMKKKKRNIRLSSAETFGQLFMLTCPDGLVETALWSKDFKRLEFSRTGHGRGRCRSHWENKTNGCPKTCSYTDFGSTIFFQLEQTSARSFPQNPCNLDNDEK